MVQCRPPDCRSMLCRLARCQQMLERGASWETGIMRLVTAAMSAADAV